jgi:hypothetical protein
MYNSIKFPRTTPFLEFGVDIFPVKNIPVTIVAVQKSCPFRKNLCVKDGKQFFRFRRKNPKVKRILKKKGKILGFSFLFPFN